MSKRLEEIKKMLFEKKAEKDNTIDLNAYAMGLADMAKESENYAREVAQASLERASDKACDSLELYNSEYEKLIKSITNPDNIVL